MPTTTPNNGWSVPVSTDFVKDGAVAIETLGDAIDASVGTGLLAWTSFVPIMSGITIGNGTVATRYSRLGKTVNWRGSITFGTTTTLTSSPIINMPITCFSPTVSRSNGYGNAYYGSTAGVCYLADSGLNLAAYNAAGTYVTEVALTSTIPLTWTTGSTISWFVTYQTT